MDLINLQFKKIRILLWNLVFSFLLIACKENKNEQGGITIQWKEEKAEAVILPLTLFTEISADSIAEYLQVRLIKNPTPILHDEIRVNNVSVTFKPLVPFTRGLQYEVFYAGRSVGQFEIPELTTANLTRVMAVYPSADTLPENLLKLYIIFSKPMQEGQALYHINFIKNDRDTVPVFLDLAQELWNRERTILTLWFDPGRIKRKLQPNVNSGIPLEQTNKYTLMIDSAWLDERGLSLQSDFEKKFTTGKRDEQSPDPANWNIIMPKANSSEALMIDMHEPLDYMLLKNAVSITANDGNFVKGTFEPVSKETRLRFTPDRVWKTGEYTINFEARLEDLAGNNLNRLFDRDLKQPDTKDQQKIFKKKFTVL